MAKVTITIVSWNSMKYLPDVLKSIDAQTYKDLALVIIDNGSSDGVEKYVNEHHPKAVMIRNVRNLGFAHGHNQGIAYAKAYLHKEGQESFMLVTNPDIILEPDFVEKLMRTVENKTDVGSAGGMLLRVHQEMNEDIREIVKTDVIDSAGLRVYKSGRVVERGAGESSEDDEYNQPGEVFGLSGAVVLYRMSALEDVAYRGEYFDEDFFAYKEDVDMAWRMRLRGWQAYYVPASKAYHYRAASGNEKASIFEIFKNRKRKSAFVNYLSHRNHLSLLVKNLHVMNIFKDGIRIFFYEFGKFIFILLFEQRTLRAIGSFFSTLPKMLQKRRVQMGRAEVRSKDIRELLA